MAHSNKGDLQALAESFPTLCGRIPLEFFDTRGGLLDACAFAAWARPLSGGEREAVLFVLSVWNSSTNWHEAAGLCRSDGPMGGRFDVHRALGTWDQAHRDAFLAWARDPWWC
jgi:hypothetical protein